MIFADCAINCCHKGCRGGGIRDIRHAPANQGHAFGCGLFYIRHILRIQEIGRSKWRGESGYYRQSHAENGFFRYKTTLGGWLRAKNMAAQEKEVALGCAILNRMREMGRPISTPVA